MRKPVAILLVSSLVLTATGFVARYNMIGNEIASGMALVEIDIFGIKALERSAEQTMAMREWDRKRSERYANRANRWKWIMIALFGASAVTLAGAVVCAQKPNTQRQTHIAVDKPNGAPTQRLSSPTSGASGFTSGPK
jgi:type IV secretory pathway component VirB8